MTPLKGVLLGAWLAAATAAACFFSYKAGWSDGETFVVDSCNSYSKYAMDGTRVLLCSAIITPEELAPSTLTQEQYSKENKAKHKKDRR